MVRTPTSPPHALRGWASSAFPEVSPPGGRAEMFIRVSKLRGLIGVKMV